MTAPATIIAMIGLDDSNEVVRVLNNIFSMQTTYGMGLYLLLIFVFAFFYSNMQIDPYKITENFSKSEPIFQVFVQARKLQPIYPVS